MVPEIPIIDRMGPVATIVWTAMNAANVPTTATSICKEIHNRTQK
jgi:hypothetical protein